MKPVMTGASARTHVILAAVLLAAGLLVDIGFIRPGRGELARLKAAREDTRLRLGQQRALDEEAGSLAASLGVSDLAEAMSGATLSDPVTFLGGLIADARLTRLELATHASADAGSLHRTRFSLRVLGAYPRILQLVQSMERSSRLVTVDAFSLQPAADSADLEGRLDVSIYDPAAERRP